MSKYALVGGSTNDLLTLGGRVIVHDSKEEMEWLMPNTRVVRVNGDIGPTLSLREHPSMASVQWPLNKNDFY